MRIKLDENLPHDLSPALAELGHDVRTVVEQGLTGRADDDVWRAVTVEQRFLITQDVAFGRVSPLGTRPMAGVLLVRLSHPSKSALVERVASLFETEDVDRWDGCLVVATEKKLRVRKTQ